jgi:branched-chain amino acid transport system permease protein
MSKRRSLFSLSRRERAGVRGILAAIVTALVLLLAAPRFLERGTLNDIWNVAFAVILASAWNLLGGFAGQVSIGYSAFIGIGAYTTALLSLAGWHPYATLPASALLAAAFSFVVGLPTFRLRGPYFTIATIGVSEAVRVVAAGVSWTGGSSGLRMPAGSFDFSRDYSAMVILAVAVVALSAWIKTSPFGQALRAIRQDIDAAEALGVNSTKYKVLVHALSAAIVAVAGSLFAVNFQYISPNSVFDFRLSLSIVLMPIVGGLGTVAGPVLGALLFGYLQIKLLSSPALRDSYLFLYGGMLILVMLFEPKGLLGLYHRLRRAVTRSPARTVPDAG